MWFHPWLDSLRSGPPQRRAPRSSTHSPPCCRPVRPRLSLEHLEDRNLLSGGLSPTLVALGGATPRPIPLPLALAASPFKPPGLDIYQNFQGPADADPTVTPLLGNEPNQITDFYGSYGGVRVQGTGQGHEKDGPQQTFFWDADLRFMKGVYRGVDGDFYRGTFVEV
jgi:hypothetical protein